MNLKCPRHHHCIVVRLCRYTELLGVVFSVLKTKSKITEHMVSAVLSDLVMTHLVHHTSVCPNFTNPVNLVFEI